MKKKVFDTNACKTTRAEILDKLIIYNPKSILKSQKDLVVSFVSSFVGW